MTGIALPDSLRFSQLNLTAHIKRAKFECAPATTQMTGTVAGTDVACQAVSTVDTEGEDPNGKMLEHVALARDALEKGAQAVVADAVAQLEARLLDTHRLRDPSGPAEPRLELKVLSADVQCNPRPMVLVSHVDGREVKTEVWPKNTREACFTHEQLVDLLGAPPICRFNNTIFGANGNTLRLCYVSKTMRVGGPCVGPHLTEEYAQLLRMIISMVEQHNSDPNTVLDHGYKTLRELFTKYHPRQSDYEFLAHRRSELDARIAEFERKSLADTERLAAEKQKLKAKKRDLVRREAELKQGEQIAAKRLAAAQSIMELSARNQAECMELREKLDTVQMYYDQLLMIPEVPPGILLGMNQAISGVVDESDAEGDGQSLCSDESDAGGACAACPPPTAPAAYD